MRKIIISTMLVLSQFCWAQNQSLSELESSQRGSFSGQVNYTKPKINHRGTQVFFEDFQSQALPAGWALFNLDGLTPAPNVSYVTDAWVVRDDFITVVDPVNYAAFSTSWYSPAGIADDWLVSPLISLPSSSILQWLAYSPDAGFRDGYEVYVTTSTPDVAGCQAGTVVFSVAEEEVTYTARSVNLSAQGFGDEDVHVCFRNNSNDKFLLILDDIEVVELIADDLAIDSVAALPEYPVVPDKLSAVDVPLSVDFTNNGAADQSSITVQAEIFLDMVLIDTVSMVEPGPLASGASTSVDLGAVQLSDVGVYDIQYTLIISGNPDGNPSDNVLIQPSVLTITTDTMARDDDVADGSLGIGNVASDVGYLGQMFEFDSPVTLTGVFFNHNNNQCDTVGTDGCTLDNESLRVDVFAMDQNTGLPGVMISSSDDYVVQPGPAQSIPVTVMFAEPLNLMPGQYVFAVTEPVDTGVAADTSTSIQLATSIERFQPGVTWINWPTIPTGQWSNNEAFGFNVVYLVRPQFTDTDLIFRDGF